MASFEGAPIAASTLGKQPESTFRSSSSFSFGSGKEFGVGSPNARRQPTGLMIKHPRKGEREPGVGAHGVPEQFGKQPLSHMRTGRAFKFSERSLDARRARILQAAKDKCVESPGPGAYSMENDDRVRHPGSHGQVWNTLPRESAAIDEVRRRNPLPPAPGHHSAGSCKARAVANMGDQELASSTLARNKAFPIKKFSPAYSFGSGFGAPLRAAQPRARRPRQRKLRKGEGEPDENPQVSKGRNAVGKQTLSVHRNEPAYTMRGPGGQNESKQLIEIRESTKELPSPAHYDQSKKSSFNKQLESGNSTAPKFSFGDGKEMA